MKKLGAALLIVLSLVLALAVPASAKRPTQVSGTRWILGPPPGETWRSAGSNCITEFTLEYEYEGDLVGTSVNHFRAVSHGPCGTNGAIPYMYHETIHIEGTFTGEVQGTGGSFDFIETAENWPEGSHKEGYFSRLVILSGTDDLAGLHGVLDIVYGDYSGQVQFEPSP